MKRIILATISVLLANLVVSASAYAFSPDSEIAAKYNSQGGGGGFLGPSITQVRKAPDGIGYYQHYQNGSIYWSPSTGAHEVHGQIREKWANLGWELSPLGYPLTDERITSYGIGGYNLFQKGAIYWSPQTGANAVYGVIYTKWIALGGTKSVLGFPTTDETGTPNPTDAGARFNNFQNGAIYWKWDTGAYEVRAAIYAEWKKQGGEWGKLGFPVSDELPDPIGTKRFTKFQGGILYRDWSPSRVNSIPDNPTPPFVAVRDRSLENLSAEHNNLTAQGFRILSLSVYGDAADPLYACVWVKDGGPGQKVCFKASADEYQAFFDSSVAAGFKPIIFSATGSTANPVFAAVFEERPGPVPLTRYDLVAGPVNGVYSTDSFAYWCKWARENHHILRWAAVYGDPANPRYAGIWELDNDEVEWNVAFHNAERRLVANIAPEPERLPFKDFAENDLQAIFEAQSYWARPAFLTHSSSGRFIEVFRDDQVGDWISRVNLTSDQYQAEFNSLVAQGYLPTCVQGAKVENTTRFTAIFARRTTPKPRELTVTGQQNDGLIALDEAMEDIVRRNDVRSASLAIAKDGQPVYARAFTWAEDGSKITQPENIFRIASCSKPLTAVAIYQLMEAELNLENGLKLDDLLIKHIKLNFPPGVSADGRFNKITIRQLLQHKSGIERNGAHDNEVLNFFNSHGANKTLPLSIEDVATYMATRPLLYDPGYPPQGQDIYSNVGFLFLSLLVQQKLGDYTQAINNGIFSKVGITQARVTGSQTIDQGALEVIYYDRYLRVGKSVMSPEQRIAPLEYGTLNFNNSVGVGGWAMSPADYVRFLSALHSGSDVLLKPENVKAGDGIKAHGGLLAGAVSYVEHFDNGITLAVVFNKTVDEDYGLRLRDILNALPASAWPIPLTYEGALTSVGCRGIVGFALDNSQPGAVLSVDIYDGDKPLATVLANQPPQVSDPFGGQRSDRRGNHSFSYPLPESLKDGKPHSISVKYAGTSVNLSGSPKQFVNSPPVITQQQPDDVTVCTGKSATFSVTAAGVGLTYQWRKDGRSIANATGGSYTISSVSVGDAGIYDVVIKDTCGNSVNSAPATLMTVSSPISITDQPDSVGSCMGKPVTFSVTATGTNLHYQWRKNGGNISGATGNSYTIPSLSLSDAGAYSVVVYNGCSTANSAAATLTVNSPISITSQPVSMTRCQGQSVTFSVAATGTDLHYLWRKNGGNISGAAGSSYTIPSVSAGDAGDYSVLVYNGCNKDVSASATLTVNPAMTLSPTSLIIDAFGGSSSVGIRGTCSWTAVSNASWITITGPSSGTGNGGITYHVSANTGPVRKGTMTIAGQTFPVKQQAGGNGGNDSRFVPPQRVPISLSLGQRFDVEIKMKNTGTTTWTTAGGYRLVSQGPVNNDTWGLRQVGLPQSVAPGGEVTFNFTITAPATPGTHRFEWQMMQGDFGFGAFSPDVQVTVTR